jgi:hypothetical protein
MNNPATDDKNLKEQVASLLNKPYKVILESKKLGVKLTVEVEAEDQPEAERRARLVVEHFKVIMELT